MRFSSSRRYASNLYIRESQVALHQEKPWWCSGQHTRSGILRSLYPTLALPKLLSLSLEGREVASSNLAYGALYWFLFFWPLSHCVSIALQ